MPVKACSKDGKDGFQYGDAGTCYTHDGSDAGKKRAKKKAVQQALAIGGGKPPSDLSARDLAQYGEKECASCGSRLAYSKFPEDKRTSDGHSKVCVACRFNADRGMSEEEPETVDLDGVPILAAGGPYFGAGSPPEGDFFDVDFLKELANANNELKHEVRAPIKIGHSKKQTLLKNSGLFTDEMPAAGWLENLRVSGDELLADIKAVPKKLADLVKLGAFRTRSVELAPVTSQTQDGKVYDTVVTGLALLGAKAPAVRTLNDILAFYTEQESDLSRTVELVYEEQDDPDVKRAVDFAAGDVIWDAESGTNDMREDLNAAINAISGPPGGGLEYESRFYVMDIDQVNRRCIVNDYRSNSYWVVAYNIDDGGEPVPAPFSEWTLAEQAWVEAAEESATALSEATQILRSSGDTKDMSATETRPFEKLELSDEQVEVFAQGLGIEEPDADKRREAVISQLSERAKEPAAKDDEETPKDEPAPKPETTPADDGVVLSQKELAELREKAELGAKAYAERNAGRIEGNIQVALRQGRITPAQEPKWRKFYEVGDYDLVTEQLLLQPINPSLTKTFGSDDNKPDPHADRRESDFRTYAEMTGVPYRDEKGEAA